MENEQTADDSMRCALCGDAPVTGGIITQGAIVFRCAVCDAAGLLPPRLREDSAKEIDEDTEDDETPHSVEMIAEGLDILAKAYSNMETHLLRIAEQLNALHIKVTRLVAHMEGENGDGHRE